MATLTFSQIRAYPGDTIQYIANKDKIISDKTHDVYKVLNYMGEPESTERIYTFSRHCSSNPALAGKQMEVYRQNYYASKRGAKEHEGELLGLHFFISYTEEDDPTDAVMTEIAEKLTEHPLLRDFASFGANHFDQQHRHTHWYSSQFSAVGKPRKMGLQREDIKELKRHANRLCVERGLSIIDDEKLRKDPEYVTWIEGVIAEGNVTVHKLRPEKRRKKKQSTRNMYYRWMKEKEEMEQAEYRMLTEAERKKKAFDKRFYCSMDGENKKRYYVSGDPVQRFYAVERYTKTGTLRSELECQTMLFIAVLKHEGEYIRRRAPDVFSEMHAVHDWKLQNMYDCIQTAIEMNVNSYAEVEERIKDVGKQMNIFRREIKNCQSSIESQERIIQAHEAYARVQPLLERREEIMHTDEKEYSNADAVLAQNQIVTEAAYEGLCKRHEFEKQKIEDYDRRILVLKKQYRDLKKLEAMMANPPWIIDEVYRYTKRADKQAEKLTGIDQVIGDAYKRADGQKGGKTYEQLWDMN